VKLIFARVKQLCSTRPRCDLRRRRCCCGKPTAHCNKSQETGGAVQFGL